MVHLRNLSSVECFDGLSPWRYVELSKVPDNCLKDKAARDAWINTPSTSFNVYTLFEGVQGNLRLRSGAGGQDDNPPLLMSGLAVDYDAAMSPEQAAKALPLMGDCPPTWFEQTLSGNGRLIWMFQNPLRLPSRKFLLKVLPALHEKIPYRKLAGLDEGALKTPERYFTNGCRWTLMSRRRVPDALLRGFIMTISEKFDWQQKEFGKAADIKEIADECRKLFPRFHEWPGEFSLGSTGPSFWIDGSTSPKSAIVRETGLQTFSAHATKAFYPWAEIVGSKFVEDSEHVRFGKAIEGCYYDGQKFIVKDGAGVYAYYPKDHFRMILQGVRGLKAGATKDGSQNEVDRAITHIMHNCAVAGASSCAFYPHGVFNFNGTRILNTHQRNVLSPVPDTESPEWGPEGKFPWLSKFFDEFFDPVAPQKERFLAWFRYHYNACLNRAPVSGHGMFIAGPVGSGKTFLSRAVVGTSLGGFAEANNYLISSDNFNSELFEYALWVIDDGSVASSSRVHQLFTENVKRSVANRDHRVNEKFRKAVITPWQGRIFVTLNLDPKSLRLIPDTDASILEKIFILKASGKRADFRTQEEMVVLLQRELPWFLRWLLNWTPPAHCYEGAEVRFGIAPYAEPSIVRAANLSSGKTVFLEIVTRWLKDFFTEIKPSATFWEGTATDLRMAMTANAMYSELLRGYRPEELPNVLLTAMNKGTLKIEVMDDTETTRKFRIHRDDQFGEAKSAAEPVPQSENSNFQKK